MFDHSVDTDRRFAALRSGLIVPADIAVGAVQTQHLASSVYGSPAASGVGDAAADGTNATLARSNHRHAREAFASPVATADALADGAAATVARSDHVHRVPGIKAPGSAFPGAPVEGDLFYETDTDIAWVRDGANWVEFVRAARWAGFTPVITQGATITKTSVFSEFVRTGRLIVWNFNFGLTSAGTAGQPVALTLPATAQISGSTGLGSVQFYDTSTAIRYVCVAESASSTAFNLVHDTSGGNAFGAAPAITIASGDIIRGQLAFQASANT